MSRFSKHFKMNEQDAIEYILEKVPDFCTSSTIDL